MKNILNRIIGVVMVVVIMLNIIPCIFATDAVDWSDVGKYYPFNSWAAETGMKYDFIFLENNSRNATRKEIASLLYNIADLTQSEEYEVTFTDCESLPSKELEYIRAVSKSGIIMGYSDNTFKPLNSVTRAEFVTMLYRSGILDKLDKTVTVNFSDCINHWAKKSIEHVAGCNIVSGKGNNKFYPDDTITLEEIFIILDRLVEKQCISKHDLLNAMLNTFKCKVYSEEEKFITETIYGNFQKVQNAAVYTWPYTKYYNPSNWQGYASYEDLQKVLYFTTTAKSQIVDEEEKKKFNNIVKYTNQAREYNKEYLKYGKNTFTIGDLIVALSTADCYFYMGDKYNPTGKYYGGECELKYSNASEFSEIEKVAFHNVLCRNERDFILNENFYLPLEAPVTKLMLNYFIEAIREKHDWYSAIFPSKEGPHGREMEFETDPSKFPSNYREFPYIIKGVPKDFYETMKVLPEHMTPGNSVSNEISSVQHYYYGEFNKEIVDTADIYYNTILNIDYRTIDEFSFKFKVMGNSYVNEETVDRYLKYVKDNEIIIKGSAWIIPGTITRSLHVPGIGIGAIFEFEVISAKEPVNLLLQDCIYPWIAREEYTQNKYKFYLKIRSESPAVYNGEVGPEGHYMVRPLPIGYVYNSKNYFNFKKK